MLRFIRQTLRWGRRQVDRLIPLETEGPEPVRLTRLDPTEEEPGQATLRPDPEAFLRQTANQLLTPTQRDRQRLRIQALRSGEEIDTEEESWEHRGAGFIATRTRTLVQTRTNQIVPIERICCVCSACQGFDVLEYRCLTCGRAFCRLHVRLLHLPSSISCYCLDDLTAARDRWHVWNDLAAYGSLGKAFACLIHYPKITAPHPNGSTTR